MDPDSSPCAVGVDPDAGVETALDQKVAGVDVVGHVEVSDGWLRQDNDVGPFQTVWCGESDFLDGVRYQNGNNPRVEGGRLQ